MLHIDPPVLIFKIIDHIHRKPHKPFHGSELHLLYLRRLFLLPEQGILDLLRQAVQGGERFMAGLASSSPLRCP